MIRSSPPPPDSALDALTRACARLDRRALGMAVAAVCGTAVFLATAWLVVKGGLEVGPNLTLLAQYFPGYRVTWPGALAGFAYGAATGFLVGWAAAALRNLALELFLRYAVARDRREAQRRMLDYV